MIRYIVRLPARFVITAAAYLLAPFAVWLFSTDDKRHLTHLRWLETIDNDLTGDPGWKRLRLWGGDPLSFVNRTRWLWRNGGNYVSYYVLGCVGDSAWCWSQNMDAVYWKRPDGYWLYRRFVSIGNKHLELFVGWNLFSIKQGRCKVVCQIRLRSSV